MNQELIELLKKLVSTPSFSGEESLTAEIIHDFLLKNKIKAFQKHNNIWALHRGNKAGRRLVLLNSHHDTVKPCTGWDSNPFVPTEQDGKLIGLGTNDAGASVVAQLAAFIYLNQKELPFNLAYSATAEEENSGTLGLESILADFGKIDLVVVGEPTKMEMAVAERGLMVLDCRAYGKAGHAARNEGDNAIYKALNDILFFKNFEFPRISDYLGKVKMTVTQISSGKQHNTVPDICHFVVDVRSNGLYTHEQLLETIRLHTECELLPRSVRLNSSSIVLKHPVVTAAMKLGIPLFGSPTTSDQAIIPFPSVKIGPGDSARSHTANEFIRPEEIEQGIEIYCKLIENLIFK